MPAHSNTRARPQMMEVGVGKVTALESESHMGGWVIVSSPLILGHKMDDDEVNDAIWPTISNKEVGE